MAENTARNAKRTRRKGRVALRYRRAEALEGTDEQIHLDLSAAARSGEALFVASDETAGIDILRPVGMEGRGAGRRAVWGDHVHVSFGDLIELPGGGDGEMDIEGLAIDEGWLWVAGSQSFKRGKADDGGTPAAALEELADITFDKNRQFLGRFPLVETDAGPRPVKRDGDRRAGHLTFTKYGKLRKLLERDRLLNSFLDLPGKDNGFDIEGIAVQGLRVWLGLRGPVLRGNALIVELELEERGKGRLHARKLDGKRRYRLHALPSGGEGIRDLARDGDDLLALLGPTLAGDGAVSVLRWTNAVSCMASGAHLMAVHTALDLPYRGSCERAEGLTRWDDETWLILHDAPGTHRLQEDPPVVLADLWRMTD